MTYNYEFEAQVFGDNIKVSVEISTEYTDKPTNNQEVEWRQKFPLFLVYTRFDHGNRSYGFLIDYLEKLRPVIKNFLSYHKGKIDPLIYGENNGVQITVEQKINITKRILHDLFESVNHITCSYPSFTLEYAHKFYFNDDTSYPGNISDLACELIRVNEMMESNSPHLIFLPSTPSTPTHVF